MNKGHNRTGRGITSPKVMDDDQQSSYSAKAVQGMYARSQAPLSI